MIIIVLSCYCELVARVILEENKVNICLRWISNIFLLRFLPLKHTLLNVITFLYITNSKRYKTY